MSPVAQKIHISKENNIGKIFAPHYSLEAARNPSFYEITRCKPEDLPEPDLFSEETAVYFLSHDTAKVDEDPVVAVATLIIRDEGEAELVVDYSNTIGERDKRHFANAAFHDAAENFPAVGHLTVTQPPEDSSIINRLQLTYA